MHTDDPEDLLTDDEEALLDEIFSAPTKKELAVAEKTRQLKKYETDAHVNIDPELQEVLNESRAVAMSNFQDMMEVDPQTGAERFKRICDMPRHVAAAISSIKVRQVGRIPLDTVGGDVYDEEGNPVNMGIRTTEVQIKLWDKGKSLDALLRYHGAFEKDNAQKTSSTQEFFDDLVTLIGSNGLPEPGTN